MASTVLDPVADEIRAEIEGLSFTDGHGNNVSPRAHWPVPGEYDTLPAGAVGPPEIGRVGPDEAESQLGSEDWTLTYPVELVVDLSEPEYAQMTLIAFVEAFIAAIDANQTLDGDCLDCKVVEATPFAERERNRPVLGYECQVRVLKLV